MRVIRAGLSPAQAASTGKLSKSNPGGLSQ